MVSEILLRACSQCLTLFKKAATYLLLATYCRLVSWSSSSCLTSSLDFKMKVSSPPLIRFCSSKLVPFQTYSMFEISISFLASLEASVQISVTISGKFYKLSLNTFSKVRDFTFSSKSMPVFFMSFSQCLSEI